MMEGGHEGKVERTGAYVPFDGLPSPATDAVGRPVSSEITAPGGGYAEQGDPEGVALTSREQTVSDFTAETLRAIESGDQRALTYSDGLLSRLREFPLDFDEGPFVLSLDYADAKAWEIMKKTPDGYAVGDTNVRCAVALSPHRYNGVLPRLREARAEAAVTAGWQIRRGTPTVLVYANPDAASRYSDVPPAPLVHAAIPVHDGWSVKSAAYGDLRLGINGGEHLRIRDAWEVTAISPDTDGGEDNATLEPTFTIHTADDAPRAIIAVYNDALARIKDVTEQQRAYYHQPAAANEGSDRYAHLRMASRRMDYSNTLKSALQSATALGLQVETADRQSAQDILNEDIYPRRTDVGDALAMEAVTAMRAFYPYDEAGSAAMVDDLVHEARQRLVDPKIGYAGHGVDLERVARVAERVCGANYDAVMAMILRPYR